MGWQTHEVTNQVDDLADYNLFASDVALQETVARWGGAEPAGLDAHGAVLGTAQSLHLADQANRHKPEFRPFDARGRRIDRIEFHPAWHQWLASARAHGLHASPFYESYAGRWVDWAARFYMHAQIESGSQCPTAMTLGSLPLIAREPALWGELSDKLVSTDYDEADVPIAAKRAIWIGMGMTEKQGGSDVRSNETVAVPVAGGGRGEAYRLTGHKWFLSAPMCDAHLIVAQTPGDGLACFFVPRWRPDGSKNAVEIQRLKDKVGNRSNASSEVEFRDAHGVMLGEPGRGIPTIIEMATYTRLTCAISSAGFIRQAFTQCLAYTRRRRAFGRALAEQPVMRGVLVDMMLESEGALALAMRLARAYESTDPADQAWRRIMTPAAKFWICKRAVELTGEAMEVFGGNGYVEDGVLARLFREAPVNSIWEGSGNVMCLDVLRAIGRDRDSTLALIDQLAVSAHGDPRLTSEWTDLRRMLDGRDESLTAIGRQVTARLAVFAQSCLLVEHAPNFVADAFIETRYDPRWGRVTGMVDPGRLDVDRLLSRGFPA